MMADYFNESPTNMTSLNRLRGYYSSNEKLALFVPISKLSTLL